jgi:hypothetical protein
LGGGDCVLLCQAICFGEEAREGRLREGRELFSVSIALLVGLNCILIPYCYFVQENFVVDNFD